MNRLTRTDLDSLPAYIPGRSAPGAIKLASNEMPYGPLPGVVEAITQSSHTVNRYPDLVATELKKALSCRLGVDTDRIVSGCGSVALAEHIVRATCLPGDEVIYAWRSFEAYPIIVTTTGATNIRVPNTASYHHDLSAMAAAITPRTRVILICNPNNPTGTALHREELDAFLSSVPPTILIVIDEAYREFVTDPRVPDAISTYGDRPNVAVLRTFSKAWSLAGLRLGYLVAQPEIINAIGKVVTPFSSSSVAQVAARAALHAETEMARRVANIVSERDRLTIAVRKVFPDVVDSQSNFLWLPLHECTVSFASFCERAGVIVRPFPTEGVRVTIGAPDENDAFLSALTEWAENNV